MLEGYAEFYSAELSQKVKRGMNETRRKGNYTGSRLLYGYKKDGKKVAVDEEQAEIVRYIFEQYAMGAYVKDILAELDRRGATYRGKKFGRSTVYNILKNEKYAGIYRFQGEEYDMFPQIVPTDIFDKVRAKAEKNRHGKRSVEVTYLLRHKLICGYCGQPVNAECGTSQNGERKYYYKCRGKKNGTCHKKPLRKEILEELVLNKVIEELSRPHIVDSIVNELMQVQERQMQEASALNMILKEKKKVDTALGNLVAAIEQGIVSNTTNKRLHELEARQEELERQVLIEKSKLAVKLSEETVRKFYIQALRLEPKMLIDCIIKEIVLYDDKVEIFFNSPLRPCPTEDGPDDRQGFLFYSEHIRLSFKDPHRSELIDIDVQFEMRI